MVFIVWARCPGAIPPDYAEEVVYVGPDNAQALRVVDKLALLGLESALTVAHYWAHPSCWPDDEGPAAATYREHLDADGFARGAGA